VSLQWTDVSNRQGHFLSVRLYRVPYRETEGEGCEERRVFGSDRESNSSLEKNA